jgi:hypothetical protein
LGFIRIAATAGNLPSVAFSFVCPKVCPELAHVAESIKRMGFDTASFATLACCFLRMDFSMWLLLAGAGKVRSDLAAALRISRIAATSCARGITRRAFSVLPCSTWIEPPPSRLHQSQI